MPDIFKWHHNQCCKFYSYKLSNSLRVLVVLLEKDVISSCPLLNTFNSSVISIFKFHHISVQFSSVQSLSHVRLFVTPWITACQASLSSQTPGVYSKSCSSSWWCHPAISSSVIPFSSCPQSLQASGSFPMSQFFTWGGQSIGVSASASSYIVLSIFKSWGQSL